MGDKITTMEQKMGACDESKKNHFVDPQVVKDKIKQTRIEIKRATNVTQNILTM